MTISEKILVEIDLTLCQNVFLYKAVLIFCNLAFQDKNSTEHEVYNFFNNRLMNFDHICVKMILAMSCFKIK